MKRWTSGRRRWLLGFSLVLLAVLVSSPWGVEVRSADHREAPLRGSNPDPRCPAPGGGQFVTVLGPAQPRKTGAVNDELGKRAPIVTGCTNQVITGPGIRAFAGLRDDPFVTDPAQLNRILGGAEQVFRQVVTPIGALDGRPIVNGRSGFDTFGGFNVSALIVEVPTSAIQGSRAGTGTYLGNDTTIGFWGTTSRQKHTHRSFKDVDDDRTGSWRSSTPTTT